MKKILLTLLAAASLALGAAPALASDTAPTTVIHVVAVKWKADAKPEAIKAALDGAHALTKANVGITRVWTKSFKVQGDFSQVIVMEFASQEALTKYSGSDAQKEWYKSYMPVRERSQTQDITN